MARIRTIKPELFLSETLAQVSVEAERTFTGLLTQADDKGRLRESAAVLNGALWPCRPDHTVADMQADLDALVSVGVLCRYQHAGKGYLHFPTWDEHQKISHPSTRNLAPECPVHDGGGQPAQTGSGEPSGNFPEPSGNTPQGKERKGKDLVTSQPEVTRGVVGGKDFSDTRASARSTRADEPPATAAHAASVQKPTRGKTSRPRVTTSRAKKSKANTSHERTPAADQEDDMGVYDTPIEPFTDLRQQGAVHKGRRKIGKNGVAPTLLPDVERVIEHFSAAHKATGTKFRVTNAWYSDTQALLRGTGAIEPFTADQLCDLIDFGVHHPFWHTHLTNPAGLRKHGPKLFGSDDYITWSLANNRPSANRPRNTLIKGSGQPAASSARGRLAADVKHSADDYKAPL